MSSIDSYIQQHQPRFLEELKAFLRIPSISTVAKHRTDIKTAAEFVKKHLLAAGADHAELIYRGEKGHPMVYAEKIVDRSKPTILVYGHYDVQPVDPVEEWHTPPFEPTIKGDKIYARGAADDKGQVWIHLKAMEAALQRGELKCNLKFLIEGEEEIGSAMITEAVSDPLFQQKIAADVVLVSDTHMISKTEPSIDVSLRGFGSLELKITGPNRDLHSGSYGGAVANPLQVLAKVIAALKSDEDKITIPGFYKDVVELNAADKKALNQQPFDLKKYQNDLQISAVRGEKGYTTLERIGIRPDLAVTGMWGGYTGEGIKNIIPSTAHAKISVRFVADQKPAELLQALKRYIEQLTPEGVNLEIKVDPFFGNAFYQNPNSIAVKSAMGALEKVWGKPPYPTYEGGSIPVLSAFQSQLGTDVALLGFGLSSDNIHSPNENFDLTNFSRGIKTVLLFYEIFAEKQRQAG